MEEKNTPRRPRRNTDEQPKAAKSESLVYGKNPVTELLKSGSGVDTVLLAEGMAPAVAALLHRHGQGSGRCRQAGEPQQAPADDRHGQPPGRGGVCQ